MSHPDFRKIVSLAVAGLFACMALAQSLIICPDCSHEAAGGNFCQHCGASLKKTESTDSGSTAAMAPLAEVPAGVVPVPVDDDAVVPVVPAPPASEADCGLVQALLR